MNFLKRFFETDSNKPKMTLINTDSPEWDIFWSPIYTNVTSEFIVGELTECRKNLQKIADASKVVPAGSETMQEFVTLAIELVKLICSIQNSNGRVFVDQYAKSTPYFRSIKPHVCGRLFRLIQYFQNAFDTVTPQQAPSGWVCSICLRNRDSHLCTKTSCNHFFHYGCFVMLESSVCPMCRTVNVEHSS